MHAVVKKVATVSVVALVSGLGMVGPAHASGSISSSLEDDFCSGQSAQQTNRAGNTAPVPANDTAQAVAGTGVAIPVLDNDSDPEGNQIFVTGTSNPAKGQTCVDGNGVVEYFAAASSTGYTESFRYGVTDGEYYRTATVTVTVEGIAPIRAQLKKRLKVGRHGKVTRRAQVAFTNPNQHDVVVVVANPRTDDAILQRTLHAGKSTSFTTKLRNISFAIIVPTEDDFGLVNFGELNTRTGRQSIETGEDSFFRSAHQRAAQRLVTRSVHR